MNAFLEIRAIITDNHIWYTETERTQSNPS